MRANSRSVKPREKHASTERETTAVAQANTQALTSEERLEERLKFETLLTEISAHFINLPANQIDSSIQDAQRRVCEFLDLDRSTLWLTSEKEPVSLDLAHIFQSQGSPPPPAQSKGELFPWTIKKAM